MPGFGTGPFGHLPNGRHDWAEEVLWDFIPELYRQQDAISGGLLEAFQEGLKAEFDELRIKIRDFFNLRDPLKVRTQYDEVVGLRLGRQVVPEGALEQRGVNAYVDAPLLAPKQLVAPTGRFTTRDIGKTLRVRGSAFPDNNHDFVVAALITPTTVTTIPEMTGPDAGPLTWELRSKVDIPTDSVTVEVRGGDVGLINLGWKLNDGISDFEVIARRRFYSDTGLLLSPVAASGVDLRIITGAADHNIIEVPSATTIWPAALYPPAGGWQQTATACPILIRGSTLAANNTLRRVIRIVSPVRLEIDGPALDATDPDSGNLTWELRQRSAYAQLDLLGLSLPKGLVEQDGTDLTILAGNVVYSLSANFDSARDVGKKLTILGSSVVGNNSVFTVTSVIDAVTAVVNGPLVVEPAPPAGHNGELRWELRAASALGDLTQLQASAPSLIMFLAEDFGVTVDTQESEDRQRSFVRRVAQWIELKGTSEGYRVTGAISGFDVTVQRLYRIAQEWATLVSTVGTVLEVGEIAAGRLGTDAALLVGATRPLRLWSASAAFKPSDVGVSIRLHNAVNPANDQLVTIDAYIDAHTVEFRLADTGVGLPDYGIGGTAVLPAVHWQLVRLYTTLPPLFPLYDEVVADQMELASPGFGIDRFCWETGFRAWGDITILAVTAVVPGRWRLRVKAKAGAPEENTGGVVSAVTPDAYPPLTTTPPAGAWKVTDALGHVFYLETTPVEVLAGPPPEYEFETVVGQSPVAGDAVLQYLCVEQSLCSYCPASKIWVQITAGDIATETGVAIERMFERVLERMIEEVKPAHVDLIVTYSVGLIAMFSAGDYDASLYSGSTRFSTPRGRFTVDHEGRRITVSETGYPDNARTYRIKQGGSGYISATELEFEDETGVRLPDPHNGKLHWQEQIGAYIDSNLPVPVALIAPFTARFDDYDGDVYRGDTAITASVEVATPSGGYVPSTFGTGTAGTSTYGG